MTVRVCHDYGIPYIHMNTTRGKENWCFAEAEQGTKACYSFDDFCLVAKLNDNLFHLVLSRVSPSMFVYFFILSEFHTKCKFDDKSLNFHVSHFTNFPLTYIRSKSEMKINYHCFNVGLVE